MEGMEKVVKNTIRITDTTLRDAHQSCLATRIENRNMLQLRDLDQVETVHSEESCP